MLPAKRIGFNVGGVFRAALHQHGSPPSPFEPARHVSAVQDRRLLFRKLSTEHGSEDPEQFSDEDQPGANADDGTVPTPSLKKEINTRDMFFARAKETEERLSHDSGRLSKAEDQEARPSNDTAGSTTGTSH